MQRQRFLSPLTLLVFGRIEKTFHNEAEKARRKRRVFNKLGGYTYPRNGKRECARRIAQIEGGQLKRENGLSA